MNDRRKRLEELKLRRLRNSVCALVYGDLVGTHRNFDMYASKNTEVQYVFCALCPKNDNLRLS